MIINGRHIGPDHPPYVLAELGLNHSGDYVTALNMVNAAYEAGADAVKLQTHVPDDEFCDTPAYPGNAGGESIQSFVRRCSLDEKHEYGVFEHARKLGITCLSTPFSSLAVERLERIGVPAYKAGSGQLRDLPLLRLLAATGKPIILSTGMGDRAAIDTASEALEEGDAWWDRTALLACTSEYPTPFDHVRLGQLEWLSETYGQLVGLSDHTGTIWPSIGAVALGASIIEVHFKIDACPPGPDLPVSVGPQQLADLVTGARAIWECRGGTKDILPGEAKTLEWFQASRRAT